MYPNVHGTIGVACNLGVYAITKDTLISSIIGGVLAFLSHDVMDRLGEAHYPKLLYYEAAFFVVFCAIAWRSDQTLLYFIGWFAGNLMDFIDKKVGLSIYDNKKYPYGSFFQCHRRETKFNLTLWQTKAVGVLAIIILAMFYLIEKV